MPGFVGIVAVHGRSNLCCIRAQVLLVDDSVVANDEGLHASYTVLRRPGYQREATDHGAVDVILQLAQTRRGSLAHQDFEVVPVERFAFARIALPDGLGYPLAHRSSPSSIGVLPGQAVML